MTDYISREELLKHVIPTNEDAEFRCVPLKDVLDAPSADVQSVRHGRWVKAQEGIHGSPQVKCSLCGEIYFEYFSRFRFCPNCGAKMDLGEEE